MVHFLHGLKRRQPFPKSNFLPVFAHSFRNHAYLRVHNPTVGGSSPPVATNFFLMVYRKEYGASKRPKWANI